MSDPHSITIRAQSLAGQWETLGADRYRNIVPEGVQFTFNAWGPDTCSFVLRRDPAAIHPDLTTWTPIEVEVAGQVAWDGRLKETPTQEGDDPTISVQAEGWQYHLDDDVYQKPYVHSRMTDWVDARSFPTQDLSLHVAAGQVQVGDGGILLTFPNGFASAANSRCAATLDAGPGCVFRRVVVSGHSSNNTTISTLYIIGSDQPNTSSGVGSIVTIAGPIVNNASANFTLSGSNTAGSRYITLLHNTTSASGTYNADVWWSITGVTCYVETAYESSGVSVLKGGTVVKDALTQAAPLLSTDVSNISTGTFTLDDFALDGLHTPREVISAVNSYENFETRLLVGRKMAFRARASVPIYEIGQWSGANFQDASENSGEGIFNRVIVQGTGPDGSQLAVERFALGPTVTGIAQPANPSADVNLTSWTLSPGSLTRDTTTFRSSPASFRLGTSAGDFIASAYTQPFKKGERYRMIAYGQGASLTTTLSGRVEVDGIPVIPMADPAFLQQNNINGWQGVNCPTGIWTQLILDWVVPRDGASIVIHLEAIQAIFVDDVSLARHVVNLIDRRTFTRSQILPVDSAITTTSGSRIADLFLTAHKTTPFRGGFQAIGQGGVRRVLGGSTVHPAFIDVGQRVRCAHRIDPDTGAWGRDGTIAAISYDHDALTSTVTLDENRAGLEALLSRLSVVTGSGRG